MKLKYVGLKESEAAFKLETGIVWLPGSVHEIEESLAKKMLNHPDVFALSENEPEFTETSVDVPDTELQALFALCADKGIKTHPRNNAQTLRAKLEAGF